MVTSTSWSPWNVHHVSVISASVLMQFTFSSFTAHLWLRGDDGTNLNTSFSWINSVFLIGLHMHAPQKSAIVRYTLSHDILKISICIVTCDSTDTWWRITPFNASAVRYIPEADHCADVVNRTVSIPYTVKLTHRNVDVNKLWNCVWRRHRFSPWRLSVHNQGNRQIVCFSLRALMHLTCETTIY